MAGERTDLDRPALNTRFTTVAWVVFFAMWGLTFLAERSMQIDLRNQQYIGAGLILLGLNGARYFHKVPMSRLTVGIGMLAVAGGLLRQAMGEVSVVAMVGVTALSLLLAEGTMRVQAREFATPASAQQAKLKKARRRNG
ncbi:MAG: hypothetical protein ACYC5J_08950 [Chloroflexota bacterium]